MQRNLKVQTSLKLLILRSRETPTWTPSYGPVLRVFELDLDGVKPQSLTQLVPNARLVAENNPSSNVSVEPNP